MKTNEKRPWLKAADRRRPPAHEERCQKRGGQVMKTREKLFQAGNTQASIWRDERLDNGRVVVQYNVRFQKRYLDQKTQRMRYTTCFLPDDLPRLGLVADRAFEYVTLCGPNE